MKKLKSFILVFLSIFGLTGCNGYNRIMRERLSDESTYETIIGEYTFYEDNGESMFLFFENIEGFDYFDPFDDKGIRLELIGNNYTILKELFISKTIVKGMKIDMRCSAWIYMDTNFYFIAELIIQDTTYLSFIDGLGNIKEYMNSNKSLL